MPTPASSSRGGPAWASLAGPHRDSLLYTVNRAAPLSLATDVVETALWASSQHAAAAEVAQIQVHAVAAVIPFGRRTDALMTYSTGRSRRGVPLSLAGGAFPASRTLGARP